MEFDIVIRGGRVYDGSGNAWFKADVGVQNGSIAAIGNLAGAPAGRTIDADGLAVSPGFIDVHSHSDLVLAGPRNGEVLEPFIRQGITTLITGQCGFGPAPVTEESKSVVRAYVEPLMGAGDATWQWNTMAEFLDASEKGGVCVNEAIMAPHGIARITVMGFDSRSATPEETVAITRLVGQSVEEGAAGFSAGLWYPPGLFAETEELVAVAKAMGGKGYFGVHLRDYSETAMQATREAIEIGKEVGIPVHLVHYIRMGSPFWPNMEAGLELVEKERANGVDITLDLFPYTSGNTYLTAVFPPWALGGGWPALVERLANPEIRKKIKWYIENGVPSWPAWVPGVWQDNLIRSLGWDNIIVAWTPVEDLKWMEGRSLQALADETAKDPFDVLVDVTMRDEGSSIQFCCGVSGNDEDESALLMAMKHPAAMFETDAFVTGKPGTHPAGYGTFPRILGRYARDQKVLTLEEAVRKSTSASASRVGLRGRGLIKEDMAADITIFNPQTVIDKATLADPQQFPEGIEYVLINGKVVLDQEKYDSKASAGKVLRNRGDGVY